MRTMRIGGAAARRWMLGVAVLMASALCGVRAWAAGGDQAEVWQPTQAVVRLEDYAGSAVCASCHHAIGKKHADSEMALSGTRPVNSRILQAHPTLTLQRGNYSYSIRRDASAVLLTVSDGHSQITEPLLLAIGAVGQTFLFSHQGVYYRTPFDYYSEGEKFGLRVNPGTAEPTSLEAALGQRLSDGVRGCARCHSPTSMVGEEFDLTHLDPGATCESCHGPGAKHVAAIRAGRHHEPLIFNPARLGQEEELNYCGACHHTSEEVKKGDFKGIRTVIPQAYRLAGSRCWNASDHRSRCTFCHDPHAPLVRDTAAYDGKCLDCHITGAAASARADQPGKACPVGKRDCAGCHMPKIQAPDTLAYTDHRIRIVTAGAPYPE